MRLFLLVLMGCTESLDPCGDFSFNTHTGTIADVSWQTRSSSTSWVEFGTGLAQQTPEQAASTTHQHTLLGLPAGQQVDYRLNWDGRGRAQSCEGVIETEEWPDFVPPYEVTKYDSEKVVSRYVMISNAGEEEAAPVVLDRQGNLVWYSEKDDALIQTQLDFVVGESGMLVLEQDMTRIDPELSQIRRIDWTLETNETIPVWGAHHKFYQHEDGTIAYLSVDIRDWVEPESGTILTLVGDTIVERAPDGEERVVFSVWDVLEVEEHGLWDIPYYTDMVDWTHANSLSYREADGSYLVSLGNTDTLIEIDRDTGELLDTINEHTYAFSADSVKFNYQHDAKWTDDDTLLMTTTMGGTFAVEYEVDRVARTVKQIWSHGEDKSVFAVVLGEVDVLPNGNRFVSFGMGGLIQEITATGEVVWELQARQAVDRIASVRFFDDFYAH
jgi:hypothetical protein